MNKQVIEQLIRTQGPDKAAETIDQYVSIMAALAVGLIVMAAVLGLSAGLVVGIWR